MNPLMMKRTKVILKLESRKWILKIFRSRNNSRKMPREKLILNGMTWVQATRLLARLNNNYLARRRKKRRKDSPRREFPLPRVQDQHSRNLNMSEISQISLNLVINNQVQLHLNQAKLITVEQLDQ